MFSLGSNGSQSKVLTGSIPRPLSSNSLGTPLVAEQEKADKKKAAELTEQKLLAQMWGGTSNSKPEAPPPYTNEEGSS